MQASTGSLNLIIQHIKVSQYTNIEDLVVAPTRMSSIYPVSVLHAGRTAEYVKESGMSLVHDH